MAIYHQFYQSPSIVPHVAGLAFDKSETEVRDAVAAALQKLVESGRYREILAE